MATKSQSKDRAVHSSGEVGADARRGRTPEAADTEPLVSHQRVLEMVARAEPVDRVIAALLRLTEALERRDAQFAEAERVAALGSYRWDVRTGTVERSDELCRIFGLAAEEFAPTLAGYLERVHPADRADTERTIDRALREREPFEHEERIVRPDGSVRLLYSRGRWDFDDAGEPVSLVGTCQDVTESRRTLMRNLELEREIAERKRIAALLRAKNEELQEFAHTVTHDVKAPLRAIAGYAAELGGEHRERLDGRARECVDRLLEAARGLDRLIEDLLRYSRAELEPFTADEVDLGEVVAGVLRERHAAIEDAGARVEVDLAATTVHAWEPGVARILANLVDNALEFSRRATPPRVRIESASRADAVRITVADNGIGFDMRHHDRIFALFQRLVGREFDGSGAGLAIVKKLVERMGGRVWAQSAPGRGATFFVELPRSGTGGPRE